MAYLLIIKNHEYYASKEIILNMDGGLSSQMGQYLLGEQIQAKTGYSVSYDLTFYKTHGRDTLNLNNRNYEIENVFKNVKVKSAEPEKLFVYKTLFNKTNKELIQDLDAVSPFKPPMYLGGYWRTKKYICADIDHIRKMFEFNITMDAKNNEILNDICSSDCTIAMHLRFGDYVDSVFDIITDKYFHNAIKHISGLLSSDLPRFYVFSNDMVKTKEILNSLKYQFIFVDINDNDHGYNDMYLMTKCHHFIISNSGVGYWPAFLSARSENKIVIQPSRWLKSDQPGGAKYSNTMPIVKDDKWIYLDC